MIVKIQNDVSQNIIIYDFNQTRRLIGFIPQILVDCFWLLKEQTQF